MNLTSASCGSVRAERVAADKEFSYIRQDIELFKKQQADKTVSLNEKVRLKEKEEADARTKARDKERLARQEPSEKTYEITLKLAQQPGLPPPMARTNAMTAKLSSTPSTPVLPSGTNSTVAAAKGGNAESLTPDSSVLDEDKVPPVDAHLIESEHILVDYLSLFPKDKLAATGQSAAR